MIALSEETLETIIKVIVPALAGGGLVEIVHFLIARMQNKIEDKKVKIEEKKTDDLLEKSDFDTAKSIRDELRKDKEDLQAQITLLRAEVRKTACELDDWKLKYFRQLAGIYILVNQIVRAGMVPAWLPEASGEEGQNESKKE